MKATVSVRQFQLAFARASAAAPSKSPKPVLVNVLLEAPVVGAGSVMALTSTDLELALRVEVHAREVFSPGSVLLHPQRVNSMLRSLGDQGVPDLLIETTDAGVRLSSEDGRYDWVLANEDPDLFPTFPEPDGKGEPITLPAESLARLIRLTVYATDVQNTRYALGGVLFVSGQDGRPGKGFALVATDGRRLSRAIDLAEDPVPAIAGMPVVPVKALRALLPLLEVAGSDPVEVSVNANAAAFRVPNARLHTRLVEGRYPRWEDTLPPPPPVRSTFAVSALIAALEAAAITTSDDSRGVDVTVKSDRWELGAKAADRGSSKIVAAAVTEGLPANGKGSALEVTFDPSYMLDPLRALQAVTKDPDANVVVGIHDARNAVALACDEAGFDGVVMPLTREA